MAGTISRGIKAPIIKRGDDIVLVAADALEEAMKTDAFALKDGDIVGVTEAVVARADGNYAGVDNIAKDVKNKFGNETVGLVFPILSRNRFAVCLKGIARGAKKIVLMFGYPSDEVGNHLFDESLLENTCINPYSDLLTLGEYRASFGYSKHPFTGIDYVQFYSDIIRNEECELEIIFSNRPEAITEYTKSVICCDTHTRERTKRKIQKSGGQKVLTLCDIMNASVDGSGYQSEYGLLGSNKATEESVKLFPKNATEVAYKLQAELLKRTGKKTEVIIYGDGAFKDPVGKIWELADPVVAVGYTDGLEGLPNELKLKFLADNEFATLSGDALQNAIKQKIKEKSAFLKGDMSSQGTTPRRLTDLVGSLCDLTSGSGDKGTPIVLVQNYFNNYAND